VSYWVSLVVFQDFMEFFRNVKMNDALLSISAYCFSPAVLTIVTKIVLNF